MNEEDKKEKLQALYSILKDKWSKLFPNKPQPRQPSKKRWGYLKTMKLLWVLTKMKQHNNR